MVCRSRGVVFTTLAVFVSVVSLRDAEDIAMSFAVDDAPSHSWDDVSRSLDQAIGSSEKQRAALLQEVVSVVQGLRQRGSNASQYINDTNRGLLEEVLVILDTHIFGAMDAAHDNDEALLLNHINVTMRACNEKLATRLTDGGDVYRIEQQVEESRARHLSCRQHEVEAWRDWRRSITDFDEFRSSLNNRTLHQFPDDNHRTMQEFDIFFLNQDPFFEWYELRRGEYVGFYNREAANETNYKGIKVDCTDNQTHFESEYCIFSFARNHACNEQAECYQNATDRFTELVATARSEEATRKDSWQAGNLIIDNLKCLLGDGSCDVETVVDYSRYTLSIPEPVDNLKCTAEQLYDASPERSPGGQFFIENEYNADTIAFEARPRSVMIECEAEPAMPQGNPADDCEDQQAADIRGNDCSFYNENPLSCGVYDTSEFTAGCVCCKCWRPTTDCDNPAQQARTLPTLYTPGNYTLRLAGQAGGMATVGCDGKVTQGDLRDKLRWDGVETQCSGSADSTFWISFSSDIYDCLRREGDDMMGTRNNGQTVEYYFSAHMSC